MPRRFVRTVALAGCAAVAMLALAGVASARKDVVAPLKVTVTMSDFKFALSTKTVPRNRAVRFLVINKGPSPHDFDIKGKKGTPVILKGKRTSVTITFSKPGRYLYICTVPRHAQYGMTGRLTVK